MNGYLDFPVRVDSRGRLAETAEDDHIRDLIQQVLFTSPGERVNRPDFGCGLKQMVFKPNGDALATATRFLVHGALQRWLDQIIEVQNVAVASNEATLTVTVVYRKAGGLPREVRFVAPPGA
jgi:phage baseplate assembly protein W